MESSRWVIEAVSTTVAKSIERGANLEETLYTLCRLLFLFKKLKVRAKSRLNVWTNDRNCHVEN